MPYTSTTSRPVPQAPAQENSQDKAERANSIQAEWMALDSAAPEKEKQRVFKLMKELPYSYIAQTPSDLCTVMQGGMPAHAFPEPMEASVQRAKLMGIQTALRWSTTGKWIAAQPEAR